MLHTLYYDLEAAANMRTNCPSSRSLAGRTLMGTVVQQGEQVNSFKETAKNKSKNPAQTNQTVRAVLANPNIKYHQLTPNIAAALGRTVDMVDAQNQDNPETAFEIFNGVLRDTSFHLGTANFNVLGLSLNRVLHPNNPFISTRQAADLTRHYVLTNNAGDAVPVLNDMEEMFNSPYFRPSMISPAGYNSSKPWGSIASGYFYVSELLRKEDIPRDSLKFFDEGFALAASMGGNDVTPEIALNYAYAIGTVGTEKTRDLHNQTGMTFFGRYTKDLLEEFHANLDPEKSKDKPPLFVSFPMTDWNGAFYRGGKALDPLIKHYRLFPSESVDERQVYNNIGRAAEIRGPLSGMILAGHGDENSVQIGGEKTQRGWKRRGSSDLKPELIDTLDKPRWLEMRPNFIDDPVVIFFSCSTGKSEHGIESMFSEVWPNGRIFAPTEDSHLEQPVLGWNGEIKSVRYNVPTRKMVGGKTKEIDRPFWMFR